MARISKPIIVLLLVVGLFIYSFRDITFFKETFISLFVCIGVIWYNKFQLTNFVNLFVLGYFAQFPIAALLDQTFEDPTIAIYQEEFYSIPVALNLLSFSLFFLFAGNVIASKIYRKSKQINISLENEISEKFSDLFLFALINCILIYYFLGIYLGTYYHVAAGDVNYNNLVQYGFLGYFYYFANIGLILAFIKFRNKKRYFFLLMSLMNYIIFMLPFFILAIFFIDYLSLLKNFKSLFVVFVLGICFLFLVPTLEFIRSVDSAKNAGFISLVKSLNKENLKVGNDGLKVYKALLAHRLSDFGVIGEIERYNAQNGYYGFDDLLYSPVHIIPTILKPEVPLNYTYDAQMTEQIGYRSASPGSKPILMLGDFYFRGGVIAVAIGFFIIGLILSIISKIINPLNSIFGLVIFIFMADVSTSLHAMTILKLFILLTKQLFIFWLLYLLLINLNKSLRIKWQ
jgi:hypothetical protein